jgi:hypothetical protein
MKVVVSATAAVLVRARSGGGGDRRSNSWDLGVSRGRSWSGAAPPRFPARTAGEHGLGPSRLRSSRSSALPSRPADLMQGTVRTGRARCQAQWRQKTSRRRGSAAAALSVHAAVRRRGTRPPLPPLVAAGSFAARLSMGRTRAAVHPWNEGSWGYTREAVLPTRLGGRRPLAAVIQRAAAVRAVRTDRVRLLLQVAGAAPLSSPAAACPDSATPRATAGEPRHSTLDGLRHHH